MLRRLAAVLTLCTACAGSSSSSGGTTLEQADALNQSSLVLGEGDTFEVSVYGEEDLSGKYRVGDDGTINFPLVGRVEVTGKGPSEVALLIQTQLQQRGVLRDPQVSVFLLEQTSRQIAVVGAVSKPGSYPLTRGMTLVQAIGAAGGLSALARGDDTIVTRRVEGKLQRIHARVEAISEGHAQDIVLQAGDIVFVPERIF